MNISAPLSPPAGMEASVCMMGVASTTACAYQASMGVTVSARPDPVIRQGECWACGEVTLESGDRMKEADYKEPGGLRDRPT